MASVKEDMIRLIQEQPDDSSFEEILSLHSFRGREGCFGGPLGSSNRLRSPGNAPAQPAAASDYEWVLLLEWAGPAYYRCYDLTG